MSLCIAVDVTNPGQFFACCGLLELAARLWGEATGWFDEGHFRIDSGRALPTLIESIGQAKLVQLDPEDITASPILLDTPFPPLRLDWWQDEWAGGKELKVWAGTMESYRIALAMQHALKAEHFRAPGLLNVGVVASDPANTEKKVEPYYFDARRGPNAHSRDVGFSPNDLALTTTAYPAVEFLCLVGLQRCRPVKTDRPRIFDYYTWTLPLPPVALPAAVAGLLPCAGQRGYRFENWFRTGQKKHKAFRAALPLSPRGV